MPKRRTGGAVQKLPSGRWRARWYTTDGRQPSRTFTLKVDAERFLRQAIVYRDREGIDVASSQTVQAAIQVWWPPVERSKKPRTVERYRRHKQIIESHPISKTPLDRLDFNTAQSFVDDMGARYAPKTVHGIYGVLNLILKNASRRGKLHRTIPKPEMPKPRKTQLLVPTPKQVDQLAAASDARLYAAVILAGYCGLRQGEVLGLQRDDVHIDEGWVFVHQARNKSTGDLEPTKTDNARRVWLPKIVSIAIATHLDEHHGEFLFPITASIFDKSWRGARARCGLGHVRFHDLRHAAASTMIHAGWNINQVAKQLGHANPTMTLSVYAHLWPDSFGDAIIKLDDYLDHD